MSIGDLRVNKLRAYLMGVISSLNAQYQQINVNFLSDDINNYSLDKIPTASIIEKWITGNCLCKDVYTFRSRNSYSQDALNNLLNIGFFEKFESIIEQRNKNGILPDIEGIEAIRCLNCGTMLRAETNTAEFDIQIQIEYKANKDASVSL